MPIKPVMGDSAVPTVASPADAAPEEETRTPEEATGAPPDAPQEGARERAPDDSRDGPPEIEPNQDGKAKRKRAGAGQDSADAPEEFPNNRRKSRRVPGEDHKGLYPPRASGRSQRMIGEVVVDLGLADRETVEEGVAAAREQGRPTGVVLVERGILRHDQLARVVAERFGLDFVDLSVFDIDMGAVNLIGVQAAKRYQAVPVGFTDDGAVLLAMANPTNVLTIDDVGMMTGRRIRPAAASVEDLNLLLARLARMDESIEDIVDEEADETG